jgi:ADP-ribose pyrophosphatase YjhB (NUDIX family)
MKKYGGIIVRANNKVLLCKRNSDGSLPGHWSCPAGSIKNGESTLEGAMREFMEETDLPLLNVPKFCGIIKRTNRDGTKPKGMLYCYLYDIDEEIYPDLDSAKDGDEHTECGYFGKDELPLPMTEQFNKLLNILLK